MPSLACESARTRLYFYANYKRFSVLHANVCFSLNYLLVFSFLHCTVDPAHMGYILLVVGVVAAANLFIFAVAAAVNDTVVAVCFAVVLWG
jgi:hypothetical protein